MGPKIEYAGANFDNVRAALTATYFLYEGMPKEEWREALGYVVPMQHNFENPIRPGGQDTWMQYWIDEDDRMTQDYTEANANLTMKVAHITVRFLGKRAETWAKAFHHLVKRKTVPVYFAEYCNGRMLEYVGPIVPVNVDYFGVGNTTVAHDLSFMLQYEEVMKFDWKPLEYISVATGEISGRFPQEAEYEL
jgi:hypothetical protein